MKILLYQRRTPYNNADLSKIKTYDVSDDVKLKMVLMAIFQEMETQGEWEGDLLEAQEGYCETCDGEGEVKVKSKSFACPDCKGSSITKEDLDGIKEFVQTYEKAKNGELEALKELIAYEGSSEVKITEL